MRNKQIYAKFCQICKIVENVKICAKCANFVKNVQYMQNVQNCAKCANFVKDVQYVQMCKIVPNLKEKSAKYIKLCINVLNVSNCVIGAKFGKMYRIVQKLCKLENMCKSVQHVQSSFFFINVQDCAKCSKFVKM